MVLGGLSEVDILDLSLVDSSYVQFTATLTDGTYGVLVGLVAHSGLELQLQQHRK